MELFKLFGSIAVDNQNANKAIDETTGKAEKSQSRMSGAFAKIGSRAVKVGKVIGTGLVAGVGAISTLVTKAVLAAGELEQNMGGSEAVFKEYASSMQETAKNAFSNMGLSTSDFLATANKMGALFQGVGFDIKSSADLSSQAMQRAADVASIMGIDTVAAMESIAGAAKGNFTMMDNLGVAMNDTTLNAYALEKGINKTTQQMTNQEKVALAMQMFLEKTQYAAGNYAKENETLAGSLGTAKAALTNFLDGSGSVKDIVSSFSNAGKVIVKNVTEILPGLVSGLSDVVGEILPSIPSLVGDLLPGIVQGATTLITSLVAQLPGLLMILLDVVPSVITAVTDIFNSILPVLPVLIQTLLEGLIGLLPDLVSGLLGMFTSLMVYLPQIIQPIIDNLPQLLLTVLDAVLSNLPMVITGLGQLISGIVAAIPQLVIGLVEAVPSIISMVVTALIQTIPVLLSAVGTILSSLGSALWGVLSGVPSAIVGWVGGVFSSLTGAIRAPLESIKSIFSTAFNSVLGTASTVFGSIKSTISGAINGAKTIVETGLNAIKGFFSGLKLDFPKIKLPHFSISGKFSLSPLSVPKLSISWYSKAMDNAMLLNKPTIFGMNPNGGLLGGGEAGQEVISGANTLMGMIQGAVQRETAGTNYYLEQLLALLAEYFPEVLNRINRNIVLDDGTLVAKLAPKMDAQLGNMNKLRMRGT